MVNRVVIFTGSKRDFDAYLEKDISNTEDITRFMEVIQNYNFRLRPSNTAQGDNEPALGNYIENCVVRAEDYASVLEHVISNFITILTLNHDIGTLYIQNPPKRVIQTLKAEFGDAIEFEGTEYSHFDKEKLRNAYAYLKEHIIGQQEAKKQVIANLYKEIGQISEKPIVILLYGVSGVGKTETAKCISKALGGDLLRIQFSMMQTNEAYNYIFGSEHSKSSFARDLQGRETNIILIDEFDKVNPAFYNAFYELFDDGVYVDTNYEVDLRNSVFICTSNFMSEDEVKHVLGPAMFSRIGCCIRYDELTSAEKEIIVRRWYSECVDKLQPEEKEIIEKSDILDWFIKNIERFDNIRLLRTKMENAIYQLLSEEFIFSYVDKTNSSESEEETP